jgi:hypothetical protein
MLTNSLTGSSIGNSNVPNSMRFPNTPKAGASTETLLHKRPDGHIQ